jgi:hypothetical protein
MHGMDCHHSGVILDFLRIAGTIAFADGHGFLLCLRLSRFKRDTCFSNSAALAMRVAACSSA